jgi:hypothetical protein
LGNFKNINSCYNSIEPLLGPQPCALLFWKQEGDKYPLLAKLAHSVVVERVFSQTGYIMRPNRRKFNDKIAENLFFIKCNIEKFNWHIRKTFETD